MTKEGRMIGAKIYAAANEDERKKKNVGCYKEYYEELKDEIEKPKEIEKPEEPKKKAKKGAK